MSIRTLRNIRSVIRHKQEWEQWEETILYARVSSTKQDTLSQWPQLNKWSLTEGLNCTKVEDTGTGRNMSREGIQGIMAGIRGGRVKRVVVVSLNRVGRNVTEVASFIDLCIKHDVTLISLRENIDISTPFGRVVAIIIAALANLENEQRSEATRAGIEAAKERATKEGRQWRTGFRSKGASLKVTEAKAAAIAALKSQGYSYRAIGREVGISDKTVRDVILNPRPVYLNRRQYAEWLKRNK